MVHRSHRRWRPTEKAGDMREWHAEKDYANPGGVNPLNDIKPNTATTLVRTQADPKADKGPFEND